MTDPDTPTERLEPAGGSRHPGDVTVPENPATDDLAERLRLALAPHLLLVRELGKGGMGTVYLAREPALKRTVAVKVLAPDLAAAGEARARFEREAQAVAGLSHPNVVNVHGVGELADGTPYFVMQYVAGKSLAARLTDDGPLSVAESRRIVGEIASALAAAHAKGIVHRDIKPANILCDEDSGRSLVSDFGIAAVVPGEGRGDTRLTQTGMMIGTPQYMSPEQLLAEPVTEKTDIYALGLVGYELLAGAAPFQATTPHELIAAHLRDTPRKLSEVRDDVDAETESIIASCLEKDPRKRPTAQSLAQRLAPGAGALLEWPPPGLESLHGGARSLIRRFGIASVLLLAAAIPLVTAWARFSSAIVSPLSQLVLVTALAGLIVMLTGLRAAFRIGATASRAVRAGYAWGTVAETLADSDGDSGHLIAGSRQYAALTPERRSTLRTLRLIRRTLQLAAAMLPLPLLVLIPLLGSAGVVGPNAVWLAALAPLIAIVAADQVGKLERRGLERRSPRHRSPAPKPDLASLARPWYEAFETVRIGQPRGRGPASAPLTGKVAVVALALFVVVVGLVAVPLALVGTMGPTHWLMAAPNFANTTERIELAQVARPFMPAKDPAITPPVAGRALAALNSRGGSRVFPERPRPAATALPWDDPLPEGLFLSARPREYAGPHNLTILQAARAGMTREELAYLERIARAPIWRDFATVAHAQAVDIVGGRFVVPFPATSVAAEMPITHFTSIKNLAYANASRAAYYLAIRRPDSAEVALRESIGFGFALLDNAPTLIDALIGAVVVAIGRDNLITLWTITGNPQGASLKARQDSAVAARENRTGDGGWQFVNGNDAAIMRRMLLRTASDTTRSRALRLSVLHIVGYAPCTNAREMMFGPDATTTAVFEQARRQLARFPAESALVDLFQTTPQRMARRGVEGTAPRAIAAIADLSGAVLGNRILPGCARLTLDAIRGR